VGKFFLLNVAILVAIAVSNVQFGGIENYAVFGNCDHLIGVSGDEDTIEVAGKIVN